MDENKNDIEVVMDDNGDNLEISPVYEHLNVAKPQPKEDKKNIIIPEVKKQEPSKENLNENSSKSADEN